MKSLVTGASGFLGYYIVEKLLQCGEKDIRCFVRQINRVGKLKTLIKKYKDANVEFFQGNLISGDDVTEAVKDVNVVYHCAASLRGAASDMFLNTVVTSKNLLEAVKTENIKRIVLISSFSVYGTGNLPRMATVDEETEIERFPTKRDLYSYVKFKQEMLFWKYQKEYGLPIVVIRPGVIYGPDGAAISARVGVNLFGLFLHLGNNNLLPLTYVENCADAIVKAGRVDGINGEIFNIHDDELPTSREYLRMYKKNIKKLLSVPVPYSVFYYISYLIEKYNIYSKGQLPAIFTPYKTASYWKGNRFDNTKAKKILGWNPSISTEEGLKLTFAYLKKMQNN